MRLLLHDYAGHPFPVQLSRELARRGHEVLHLYSAANATPKGALDRQADDPAGLAIEGLAPGSAYQRYAFVRRWRHEREFGRLLAARAAAWRPEAVISGNAPLDVQGPLSRRCRRMGVPFLFWVQDLVGVATGRLLRRRLPLLGGWIGRHYAALERRIARTSGAVVVITEDFVPLLAGWGVAADRLFVIENWGPLADIPQRPRDNAWTEAHGLAGRVRLLYTGMMGLKHNPDLLVWLARHFRGRPEVAVIVVSEGLGAERLEEAKAAEGLDNLLLFAFQPYADLADMLAGADIALAVLEREAGIFSVPSKVLSYLCAGRPILAAVPAENLAARIIERAEAGIVVDPDDLDGLSRGAERLLADARLRADLGRNGRAYAERTFDIGAIADRFEAAMARAIEP